MASIVAIVLDDLSTIIRKEIKFLGGLSNELQCIKDELQQTMDFLEGADLLVEDHHDVRSWVGQVRDVAHDVEDVLDEIEMHCTNHHSTTSYGIIPKLFTKSVMALIERHELATRIKDIKARIKNISETHGRYKTQYQALVPERAALSRSQCIVQYDKRDDALFLEEMDLVGIDIPKHELTNMLLYSGDAKRNVISVVGMGGLGKTTLVKQVYADVSIRHQFTHHAWLTVSESFNLEDLFKDGIRQLFSAEGTQYRQEVEAMDINRLKLVVKDFLQQKKYIIVFDDVWQRTHWDAICLAFPRNQFGSRVVITTRNLELGHAASTGEEGGSMYRLRPLLDKEASQLFCRKAFSGAITCPKHLEQICEKILRACQGLPLAIEVIGSVLVTRIHRKEEWELFYLSLGAEMKRNSKLDAMTKLISLSYYDLSLHLKNCFLYLSIFPEDVEIANDYLGQLWIAEGFVERIKGMTPEEVAQRYLRELVDRCLVQVANIDMEGRIQGIRIHDIVRHIMLLKASEQNIATIFHGPKWPVSENKIRRLALHGSISGNLEQAQSSCKSLRSIVLFKHVGGCIYAPILSNLLSCGRKLIKTLSLREAQLEIIPDEIFNLFHLKYLDLSHTNVKSVPKAVGKLQSLETLNLSGTRVTKLPVETQKLKHLRHLSLGCLYPESLPETFEQALGFRTSFRIGNLNSLQYLFFIEADNVNNIRTVTEIGNLVQLRVLGICKLRREDDEDLCSSLGKLRELHELTVVSLNQDEAINFQYLKYSELPSLQILILTGRLERHPQWICSLQALTRLEFRYSKLRDDPLELIGGLPNLVILYLTGAYQGEKLCFKNGGFPKLKKLYLWFLDELRCVSVEKNAMPNLQLFWMCVCPSMQDIPNGIGNLSHLQDINFTNMSNEFVHKLRHLDKESEAFQGILQVPRVISSTYHGRWTGVCLLDKSTGNFSNIMD